MGTKAVALTNPKPEGRQAPRNSAIVAKHVPTRSHLPRAEVLREGFPLKADLLRLEFDGRSVLIKDYARKPWWARVLGRIQVHREHRAYRWLGHLAGVPDLVGRVDAFAVAVEWVDGELLALAPDRISEGRAHLRRLGEVMDRLHEKGLVHLDLRSNKNVLLRHDGEVVVIDFASAVCLRPGSLTHRLLFPALRANDRSGYVKWKQTLMAGPLTEEEQSLVRRHGRFRRLWVINRKRRP